MRELVAPLLSKAYSQAEVDRYLSFEPDQDAVTNLLFAGNSTLVKFLSLPGQSVLLNSVWAAVIRETTDLPVHVVVGDLFVDDEQVYGTGLSTAQYASPFTDDTINLDWDGHCWLSLGDLIGDAGLIQNGQNPLSPHSLQSFVQDKLGDAKGVFARPASSMTSLGLRYVPHYALTDSDINAVFESAMNMIAKE